MNSVELSSEPKTTLLQMLKNQGPASAGSLAKSLGLTREAARQQLVQLQQQGLIETQIAPSAKAGRPTLLFHLTNKGEHQFPKQYDQLSVLLIDTISEQFGDEQVVHLLSAITDKQVAEWQTKLIGLTLKEKLQALKDFYLPNDPYIEVIEDEKGLWLVEYNCPFLNLAIQRPALCSITVSTLSRLLGVKVQREKRFQNGDGQCAFLIFADQAIDSEFLFQLER